MQLWLIPILPLVGFVINGLFGRRFSKAIVNTIAIGSVVLAFAWVLKTLSGLGSLDSAHLLVKNGSPAPVIGLAGPTGETVARILDLYPRTCPSDRLTGGDRVAAT